MFKQVSYACDISTYQFKIVFGILSELYYNMAWALRIAYGW